MRTIIIIAGGFVLLQVFVSITGIAGETSGKTRARAALVFLPVWLAVSAYNMWVGVSYAGYAVSEEAPIFAIVFGLPAILALCLWRKFLIDR